jgi:hypothetical protein
MTTSNASGLLPFDFDAWYPLVRTAPNFRSVVRVERGQKAADLAQELGPMESLLLVGPEHGSDGSSRRSVFGSTRVRRALAGLPSDLTSSRFHVVPNTGGGFVLLNADDRGGFRAGIDALPGGRRRWRFAKETLRLLGRIGSTALPGAGEVAIVTRRARWCAAPASFGLRGTLAAVASGVPGRLQKITLLLRPTNGLPARYVKVSKTSDSAEQINREISALRVISELFPGRAFAPRLIDTGQHDVGPDRTVRYLVQEALDGARSGDRIEAEHARFLSLLARRTLERRPLEALERYQSVVDLVGFIEARVDLEWTSAMRRLREQIEGFWQHRVVPCHLSHGDFTPWNLRVDRGELRAFDWEFCAPNRSALYDLFHFVVQTGVLVSRLDAPAILRNVEEVLAGVARGLLEDSLLSRDEALGAFGLYLYQAAANDEYLSTIETPPFEQADWIRRARIDLAKLLAARIEAVSDITRRRAA